MTFFKKSLTVTLVAVVLTLGLSTISIAANSEKIENNIDDALVMSRLNAFDIEVSATEDGRVTLEGEVETLYEKYVAFELAAKTTGVTEISNQITVNPKIVPDKEIEVDISRALKINSKVREWQNIDVTVNDYIVTLEGTISFYHEKIAAENIAAHHEGVMGVINNIDVKKLDNALSDKNLKKYLMTIRENQFPHEDNIKIKVNDGRVTLDGECNNLWSAYELEEEFSSVIGVQDINNMLIIPSS